MFHNGFEETQKQVATLPEVDAEAFDLLLEYIYRGYLRPVNMRKAPAYTTALTEQYAFAELMCNPDLMDHIMNEIASALKQMRPHRRLR
jgi:hypothetical protein